MHLFDAESLGPPYGYGGRASPSVGDLIGQSRMLWSYRSPRGRQQASPGGGTRATSRSLVAPGKGCGGPHGWGSSFSKSTDGLTPSVGMLHHHPVDVKRLIIFLVNPAYREVPADSGDPDGPNRRQTQVGRRIALVLSAPISVICGYSLFAFAARAVRSALASSEEPLPDGRGSVGLLRRGFG